MSLEMQKYCHNDMCFPRYMFSTHMLTTTNEVVKTNKQEMWYQVQYYLFDNKHKILFCLLALHNPYSHLYIFS